MFRRVLKLPNAHELNESLKKAPQIEAKDALCAVDRYFSLFGQKARPIAIHTNGAPKRIELQVPLIDKKPEKLSIIANDEYQGRLRLLHHLGEYIVKSKVLDSLCFPPSSCVQLDIILLVDKNPSVAIRLFIVWYYAQHRIPLPCKKDLRSVSFGTGTIYQFDIPRHELASGKEIPGETVAFFAGHDPKGDPIQAVLENVAKHLANKLENSQIDEFIACAYHKSQAVKAQLDHATIQIDDDVLAEMKSIIELEEALGTISEKQKKSRIGPSDAEPLGLQQLLDELFEGEESMSNESLLQPEEEQLRLPKTGRRMSKPSSLKSTLPIFSSYEQIIRAIERNPVTIISAETGAGKTTQVPQYILDHWRTTHKLKEEFKDRPPHILVTQPRRIAATSMARRIAIERNETLGINSCVGYKVRHDEIRPTRHSEGTISN